MWEPVKILFHPELELFQHIADQKRWPFIVEMPLNREAKRIIQEHAIVSAAVVNDYLEGIYARE